MVIGTLINNLYNNFIFDFIVIFNYNDFCYKLKYDFKCKNIYFFRKRTYVKYYVQEDTSRQVDF